MSKLYSTIGPVLSCSLALAAPHLIRHQAPASNLSVVIQIPATTAPQLAQDDSNGSNGDEPSDQPDQSGVDNPGEQSAPPGDDSPQVGPSDPQAGPSDNDNGDDSQMNANPDDSGSDSGDQNNQQPGYENSPDNGGNAQ
jgi:hypothetical protein